MQCPNCSTENREGARFCGKCGATLSLVCPQCGTELPPDLRFCDACGSELSARPDEEAPAAAADAVSERLQRLVPKEYAERLLASRGQMAGERRMVTILMADVTGSSAMTRGMDPEDVMEIMDEAFEVLIGAIARYEGTVARLEGDAILAFFGAPIAHEDDPERACRAGLEIAKGAQQYSDRLQKERGIHGFGVRVGVHTGLVVVGEVGSDLRMEYTAMGEAPNLAARLESATKPGTVLISEATHELIAPLFETQALEPIEAKGWEHPIPVFRVLAAKDVPGKVRGIAGLESPLVGREAELRALREALERLQAGAGGIVTIVGEAGIGKSRLVAEVRRVLLPQGGHSERSEESPLKENEILRVAQDDNMASVHWVEGRCLSYGSGIAYQLWLDVLRSLLDVTVDGAPQAVGERLWEWVQEACPGNSEQVYPYVARVMSLPLEENVICELDGLDGQELKSRTFLALQMVVECIASERPLVLVCEDLHWADPTSIELLVLMLGLIERVPLLLLCVFRPLKDHGSWRLRQIASQTYAQRHTDLVLEALSSPQTETLVANLLEAARVPPRGVQEYSDTLWEGILSRAEGNPFYVEEIIRSLIERGAIVQDQANGRWTATRVVAEIPIPDTLQGVLMARIDRLQEDTKRILQMASVIGRIFLYRVLAAIAHEERRLDERLLALQYQDMIRERARIPELEYIFKHDLTREAAYNGLLRKERRAFHRQVGAALERLFAERIEEQLGLLAHHWERARDARKAVEYLLRAGDKARVAYAHQEAVAFYERALPFLKELEDDERAARTLMKLGLTYHTAFQFRQARQAYNEGFTLWQRVGQTGRAAPPAPHALRLLRQLWPKTLDPCMALTKASGELTRQLFCGLVQLTPEMDVVPDMAQSWQVLQGGREYVFHFRHDVSWSDGSAVTALDFEYAWKRLLNPATGSRHAGNLYDVKGGEAFHRGEVSDPDCIGVRAADDFTLLVELEAPTGYFLNLLADPRTYAVPRHVVQALGVEWTEVGKIVTNGPFRLEAWHPRESILLARNPTYHGRFMGNVQRVELTWLPAPGWSAGLAMYEDDALDVLRLEGLPPAELDRARRRHPDEYVSIPKLGTYYLAFIVGRAPFDDARVRRALVLATDREASAKAFGGGTDFPAMGGLIPQGMPGHSPDIGVPYDPQQARRLLAQAGYPDGSGFPTAQLLVWPGSERLAEHLRAQWREILGIDTQWEAIEFEGYLNAIEAGSRHIFLTGWSADYPDPDNFLRVGLRFPDGGWRNKPYDTLVEEARRITDQRKRIKLYQEADSILMEDAAILPLAYSRLHFLVKPWAKLPVSSSDTKFWKDVIIEPH